ncbi:hypothetical protein E1286_05050 [Nonomuraea terrae]|uniref:Uncharacterized protein n=1 Tax=Nonomuraea terrae TaxID=2530383 RepID=A0A4R4Z8E1_9ACTN|nr:hypothetical protein [Nonomuraea terrae]TDD54561.1 hypothetical protein E1286_05050 [Nonomuraea terrae]
MTGRHDIVGYAEIIERAQEDFGAEFPVSTVRNWEKYRRAWVAKGSPTRSETRPREMPMPAPETTVNGTPAWSWRKVREWLIASHRVEAPAAGEQPE